MVLFRCRRVVSAAVLLVLVACLAGCHGGTEDVAPTAIVGAAVGPAQGGLLGDINGNGVADVADAIGILRIVVGFDGANAQADCDCDGATGVLDAIMVLRCVVGLAPWPIVCELAAGTETIGPDGQTLVWVPSGSFTMGSADGDEDEQPAHQVTLTGFWIGKYEVTNDLFAPFLNATLPSFIFDWVYWSFGGFGIERIDLVYQSKAGFGQHPLIAVNWNGAQAYCEHYGYSLPTEAQWEYAAAGPNHLTYPWGEDWDTQKCCNLFNRGPLWETYQNGSYPIGSFPDSASWCNAFDMAGNVAEFCSDWYAEDYYQTSPGQNPTGPEDGTQKVLRGGGSGSQSGDCRAASRRPVDPTDANTGYGFRVVWSGS